MSVDSQSASVVPFEVGRCWAGLCDISPRQSVPLAGYSGKDRLCLADTGGGLEANWLAFPAVDSAIVLVLSIDALFSSNAFEAAVIGALAAEGVAMSALWVVASHTHFAPQLDPTKPKLGRCISEHLEEVARRIAMSIRSAMYAPPAKMGEIRYGKDIAPGSVHRRRPGWKLRRTPPFLQPMAIPAPAPEVIINRHLRLWILQDLQGNAIAAVVHWSCHAVAAHRRNRVSPAHIGAIRVALRETLARPLPVIAMSGCSGDIRPDFRQGFLSCRTMAPYPFQRGFAPPTASRIIQFEAGIAEAARRAAERTVALAYGAEGALMRFDTELLTDVTLTLTKLQIGSLHLLGMNCEPSHDWVIQLGFQHDASNLAVTGYVGQVFGYLPTEEQVNAGGYEVDGFRDAFAFAGKWHNCLDMRRRIAAAISKLSEQ